MVATLSAVELVASAEDLGGLERSTAAPWRVAATRALGTIGVALACAREIKRDLAGESPRERALRLTDACARLSRSMRLRMQVNGQAPRRPSVIVANHVSYLDPLAIGRMLPVGAVAKSEIMRWPGVGEAMAELGIIFVERGCAHSGARALRKMMRLLETGVSVLVFPEGTTSRGDDVLPFSRGAFGAARLARVPVVPTTLRYTRPEVCWVGNDSLLPHALQLHRMHRIEGTLTFGPSLEPMAFESAVALADATRQCIRSLLVP